MSTAAPTCWMWKEVPQLRFSSLLSAVLFPDLFLLLILCCYSFPSSSFIYPTLDSSLTIRNLSSNTYHCSQQQQDTSLHHHNGNRADSSCYDCGTSSISCIFSGESSPLWKVVLFPARSGHLSLPATVQLLTFCSPHRQLLRPNLTFVQKKARSSTSTSQEQLLLSHPRQTLH